MPPLEENIMSEFLTEANSILQHMKTQSEKMEVLNEVNERQFKMYRETIDKTVDLLDDRMCANDKRWTGLRNIVVTIVVFVLGAMFTGGSVISSKVSQQELDDKDYANKSEVVRGDISVIESVHGVIEMELDIPHEEVRKYKEEAKIDAYKSVTGYKSRSTK